DRGAEREQRRGAEDRPGADTESHRFSLWSRPRIAPADDNRAKSPALPRPLERRTSSRHSLTGLRQRVCRTTSWLSDISKTVEVEPPIAGGRGRAPRGVHGRGV